MPDNHRVAFLAQVRNSLETRVGDALATGSSDAQLEEFEALLDHDGERVASWLAEHAANFLNHPLHLRMGSQIGDSATQAEIVCEYASTKWLYINRPNCRAVVGAAFHGLRSEIQKQAASIKAPY